MDKKEIIDENIKEVVVRLSGHTSKLLSDRRMYDDFIDLLGS